MLESVLGYSRCARHRYIIRGLGLCTSICASHVTYEAQYTYVSTYVTPKISLNEGKNSIRSPPTAQFIIHYISFGSQEINILGWRRSYRVLTFIQTYFGGNVRTCVRVLCFARYVTCTDTSTQAKATHHISVSCTSTVTTDTFHQSSCLMFSLCAIHAPGLSYQTISHLKMPVDMSTTIVNCIRGYSRCARHRYVIRGLRLCTSTCASHITYEA